MEKHLPTRYLSRFFHLLSPFARAGFGVSFCNIYKGSRAAPEGQDTGSWTANAAKDAMRESQMRNLKARSHALIHLVTGCFMLFCLQSSKKTHHKFQTVSFATCPNTRKQLVPRSIDSEMIYQWGLWPSLFPALVASMANGRACPSSSKLKITRDSKDWWVRPWAFTKTRPITNKKLLQQSN